MIYLTSFGVIFLSAAKVILCRRHSDIIFAFSTAAGNITRYDRISLHGNITRRQANITEKRTCVNKCVFLGAPEETRTPDLLIRSQTLYPAELPAHILLAFSPENVFYYSAHRPESQAFFSKNSKNSVNGHLSRKSAACGAGFQLFAVVWKRTSNWQILCNIL